MGSRPSLAAIVFLVCTVVLVLPFPAQLKRNEGNIGVHKRHGRNLFQFGSMIACSTSRSVWDYLDYGCWCGYGGSGTPVDDTDKCCYSHDFCYEKLVSNNICSSYWSTYSTTYRYTGCRQCEPESSYPLDDQQKTCKKALCECDSETAKCLANSTFNTSYIDYDTSEC